MQLNGMFKMTQNLLLEIHNFLVVNISFILSLVVQAEGH